MRELHILQYNAGKSAGRQQILLANPKMQDYDVIALQEPSHNPQTKRTHCSRRSGFWPVYEARGRLSQVMLLFNKRLSIDDWCVEQMNDCIQIAQIQTSHSLIQIVNMYVMTDES